MRAVSELKDLLLTKGLLVFVPTNWEGVNGMEPLELGFHDLPDGHKAPTRPIYPKLQATSLEKFRRLCKYFYEACNSPWATPLVIAPKATAPFVCFCGDYKWVNKHIVPDKFPISHVFTEVSRIAQHRVFLDIDWTNAFHQRALAYHSSQVLAVQTPWGLFRPRFMLEGITPATAELNRMQDEIYGDLEYVITIHDNMLVLTDTYQQAYERLETVLDRAIARNLTLKQKKRGWVSLK